MASARRPIRIAGCSGSSTDRRDAMAKLARNVPQDPIDVIIGDWMSELNMATRGAQKSDEPNAVAYEATFVEALTPALADLARNRVKVAVNAGASDTKKLHEVVSKLVQEKGLDLKVSWISGDEVLPAILQAMDGKESVFENVYTGERLADWKFKPIYAQAYLGGLGVAAAFKAGADIVICGRVADAAPVIGAAVWWHDWERMQLDCLANALIAGHLIECSSYVTGGNFTGFKEFRSTGWEGIGYPIAEISSTGQVIITKNQGSSGEVSVDTCSSQLLYEIQGPWYFNSDVVAVLDKVSFEQLEADRVALRGVKGDLPPPTTKVGITAKGGFQAEVHWFLVGLDIKEKAAMMEAQVRKLIAPYIDRFSVFECTTNGTSPDNPKNQNSATVDFRIMAQAASAEDLAPSRFARPCVDGIMCAYPGATPNLDIRTAYPRPIYEYYVTLMPQSSITHTAHLPWLATSSSIITIPPPPQTKTYPPRQPTTPSSSSKAALRAAPRTRGGATDAAGGWAELPAQVGRSMLREVFGPWGRTVRAPLGWIVHARSGDKGSDCNVGFWVRHRGAEYDWLRNVLSVGKIRELLGPEYKKGKAIDRFEFPGLKAVHFLLREHLDRGVSCTRTYDFLGKNTAEFLRARFVDVPVKFLERGRI